MGSTDNNPNKKSIHEALMFDLESGLNFFSILSFSKTDRSNSYRTFHFKGYNTQFIFI